MRYSVKLSYVLLYLMFMDSVCLSSSIHLGENFENILRVESKKRFENPGPLNVVCRKKILKGLGPFSPDTFYELTPMQSEPFSKSGRPTILIQHGYRSNAFVMKAFGRQLARLGFKVILPNFPKFSDSKDLSLRLKRFVARYRKKNQDDRLLLMGHSWGAGAILRLSLRLKDDQSIGLVLLDGSDSKPMEMLSLVEKLEKPLVSIAAENAVFSNMISARAKVAFATVILDASHNALLFPVLPGYKAYLKSAKAAAIAIVLRAYRGETQYLEKQFNMLKTTERRITYVDFNKWLSKKDLSKAN